MFRALSAPFIWLDAFVQKRFDSVCFFLMRKFGWRKSLIRYGLYALLAVSTAIHYVLPFAWGIRDPRAFVLGFLMIPTILVLQWFARQRDEAAEAKPGTASPSDRTTALAGPFKALYALALAATIVRFGVRTADQLALGWPVASAKFVDTGGIGFFATLMALEYLARTPMHPPPEKAAETAKSPHAAPAES